MNKNINSIVDKSLLYLFPFCAIVVLVVVFFTLDKGLTMRDEGWYLYLTKDLPVFRNFSQFYFYLKNIFNGDIYYERVCVFVVDIFSALIFSYGLYFFFKDIYNLQVRDLIVIYSLSIISLYIGHIPVNYVFSYVTMNREITMLSLGLLLLSEKRALSVAGVFLFVCGLFSGMLFFVMVPNIVFVIMLIMYLGIFKKDIKLILFYTIGLLCSLFIFFLFFQDFNTIVSIYFSLFNATVNNTMGSHGINNLISWIFDTLKYFLLDIFSFAVLLWFCKSLKDYGCRNKKIFLMFILILYLCVYFFNNILFPERKVATMVPFISFFCALLFIRHTRTIFNREIIVCLLISFTSICVSFGSDTEFFVRTNYLIYFIPLTYLLSRTDDSSFFLNVFAVLIYVYFIVFLTLPFRNNWALIKYNEQIFPVSSIGINQKIKLDKQSINELKQLKTIGLSKNYFVNSSVFSWGYCYLLEATPLSYEFRFNEEDVINNILKVPVNEQIILLEEKDSPHFSSDFFNKICSHCNLKFVSKTETNMHNVYYFVK